MIYGPQGPVYHTVNGLLGTSTMPEISAPALWEIVKHVKAWLANLKRASKERKAESKKAVRAVITASRETKAYVRGQNKTGKHNFDTEARLAGRWTELSFLLEDIGVEKLAKRCRIKGMYWSDPDHYSEDFLDKADIGLETMETIAKEILAEINR